MNRGFYNLTEKERNIVLDTLDFYCVPHHPTPAFLSQNTAA